MTREIESEPIDDLSRVLYRRYAMQSAALLLGLGLIGYLPTQKLAPSSGVLGMIVGGGLAWLASWVGTIPIYLARKKSSLDSVSAIMGATALRLVVAMVLALAAALSGLFDPAPLLVWLGISHAGLLVADTAFARGFMRAKESAPSPGH